jgi:hypothetical protein
MGVTMSRRHIVAISRRIVGAVCAAGICVLYLGAEARAFDECTWGWILENCESAKCDIAEDCRKGVIDYFLDRAERGLCRQNPDAEKKYIARNCKDCNARYCKGS